jgi:DNA-binding transcriptional LysR family regulator
LLVRRGPTGTTLTQDGMLVAEWATEMVDAADRLQVSMDALRAKHAEHIRVASSLSLAESLVPPILASFRMDQVGVQIVLGVQNSADVIAGVLEGRIDVGFIESPGPVDQLNVLRVSHDHLVVIAPTSHPWSRSNSPIDLREIARTPLIVREEGSGTRLMYDRLLAAHRLRGAEPFMVVESNAAVRSAVAGGMAPGVLSVLAVTGHGSPGFVQVPTDERLRQARPLRMIWREPREGDPTIQMFIKHVRALRSRNRP